MTPHLMDRFSQLVQWLYTCPFRSDVIWCNPIHVQLDLSRGWEEGQGSTSMADWHRKFIKILAMCGVAPSCMKMGPSAKAWSSKRGSTCSAKSHPCSDEHWGFRWLWAGRICNLGTPYPQHHRSPAEGYTWLCALRVESLATSSPDPYSAIGFVEDETTLVGPVNSSPVSDVMTLHLLRPCQSCLRFKNTLISNEKHNKCELHFFR